jgi:hypothetical protein
MKTKEKIEEAEKQITEKKEPVNFDTREYPVEVVIDKFLQDEYFIPHYQREFVWEKDKVKMSLFIESILLDLPIPYLFLADEPDTGKLEIVDGSQRIRTLVAFRQDTFELEGLEVLDLLNGFKFSDLLESRQRRFLRKTLRSIELTEKASADVRRDLFARINSKPFDLLPMEVRKGSYDNSEFYQFIKKCSTNSLLAELCPISAERHKRLEAEELVLRYFAYSERYQDFTHRVDDFIDAYFDEKHKNGFDRDAMMQQFEAMLQFAKKYFPNGFKKSSTAKSTPRVRFETLSVGITQALKENPDLVPPPVDNWLNSEAFKIHTTSDAANSKNKVVGRIEYVRDQLLNKAG